jgi:hypothetical protein
LPALIISTPPASIVKVLHWAGDEADEDVITTVLEVGIVTLVPAVGTKPQDQFPGISHALLVAPVQEFAVTVMVCSVELALEQVPLCTTARYVVVAVMFSAK